jgi:hypothetical protein
MLERRHACLVLMLALISAPAAAQDTTDGGTADQPPEVIEEVTVTTTSDTTTETTRAATPRVTSATVTTVAGPTASTCIGAVHDAARASIVRVESGLAVGAGFVAIDPSHVVTSRSIVAEGHDVRVIDVEGNARSARVIVTAGDDDLALLELSAALPAQPLDVAGWDALDVGREVVVVSFAMGGGRHGRHGRGDFEFSLTSGALNAIGDRAVQIDAHPAVVGSPIIDCHGDVVGLARQSHMMLTGADFTFGTGSGAIADLLGRVDHPEASSGRVRLFMGLGLSGAYEDIGGGAPDWLMGGYLQLGLTAFDSFVLGARGHFLMAGAEPSGTDILRSEARRFRIDAYVGWRQLVSFGGGMGFHFELAAGASASLLRDQDRRLSITPTGPQFIDTISERWRVRPLLMATIELGFFQIGYQIELELEDRGRIDDGGGHAYHLFSLGARF